jgi:coenzyme F420-0:L-glutamate ligase/coenzyme F420-1:gamma-L-glutamate ligase
VSKRVELLALETIPRIMPGDDLAGAILAACDREGAGLLQDDVLVVAQKVVSKAEGRIARLADVEASSEALRLAQISAKDPRIVELILRESEAIVRCVPGGLIIARHRLGVVLANAGIDQSNIGAGDEAETALLWPLDPDASAERLRREIAERRGTTTAVIVNDSLGRAWRKGTVGAAIGLSGLAGVVDMRGRADLYGRTLRSTEVGQADEIAAAASLVMGQADEGRPVVIVRGLAYDQRPASAREITRERELDLFP